MDEYMENLINSKNFEMYKNLDKATLKIILMYLKFNLIEMYSQTETEIANKQIKYAVIKSCIPSDYNYLEFLMNCNYRINLNTARNVFNKILISMRIEIELEYFDSNSSLLLKERSLRPLTCHKPVIPGFVFTISA